MSGHNKLVFTIGDRIHIDSYLVYIREAEPVIEYSRTRGKDIKIRTVIARCDCGNVIKKRLNAIRPKAVKSCGCEQHNWYKDKYGEFPVSKDPRYSVWCGMLSRCYNKDDRNYKNYGGRGITVSDAWQGSPEGFNQFCCDMGLPEDGQSIDRVNNDGEYSKENCKWSNGKEQMFNRRRLVSNKTGRTGVCVSHTRKDGTKVYVAHIYKNGEKVKLIRTEDFDQAVRVREEAEIENYGSLKKYED